MKEFFQFKIEDEELERARDLLPHGVRSAVVRTALGLILDFVDKGGPGALGLILNGDVRLAPTNDNSCSKSEHQ